ncbi:MAG: hypothetical protein K0R15_640 [Clostridiales bacterium]|jgi:hypothetical protein|nr:hypothetical protein [Clostridiales bacterium]
MRLIFEQDCRIKNEIESTLGLDEFKSILNNLFGYKLEPILYLVITIDDTLKFINTVNEYCEMLNEEKLDIKDKNIEVVGKCITGLSEIGILQQAIIIKECILRGFLYFILHKCHGYNFDNDILKKINSNAIIFLHEFGHAIDGQQRVCRAERRNIPTNDFDAISEIGQSLFGEYFAEKCAYDKILTIADVNRIESTKENLIDYITNEYKIDKYTKVRRIIYFFVQYIAYYHVKKIKVPFYDEYKNDEKICIYIECLHEMENVIIFLNLLYPYIAKRENIKEFVRVYYKIMEL